METKTLGIKYGWIDKDNVKPITRNTLFYGDNLGILREYIPDESVDLIYLDPPFNSSRSYNVLFKEESGKDSESQITAFEDTWHWGEEAQETYHELVQHAPANVATMISALREFIGANQMMAYLVMMTARLIELHRVLKQTGSIYLHCDPTASHYLKIVMDTIFGIDNYQSEIIWKRSAAHGGSVNYNNIHDSIYYYSKSSTPTWNNPRVPHDESYIKSHYSNADPDGRRYQLISAHGAGSGPARRFGQKLIDPPAGRHWMSQEHIDKMMAEGKVVFTKSGMPRYKRYLEETDGTPLGTIWDDIFPVNSQAQERLGYPTQKPLILLERIIQASSNEGDIVFDCFCGCGTAITAAQKLNRRWIGIDITHLAISLMKFRLHDAFNLVEKKDYDVIGEPISVDGAIQLSKEGRYQFQWWALSLVGAKPLGGESGSREGKKGSDRGIDGVINFIDEGEKSRRVLVQVKSGHVKSGDIRDLRGTIEREGTAIGVFITLEAPSKEMITEAVSSGYYYSKSWDRNYPRIQIITIKDLLDGKSVDMPPAVHSQTFKKAEKIQKSQGIQGELGI